MPSTSPKPKIYIGEVFDSIKHELPASSVFSLEASTILVIQHIQKSDHTFNPKDFLDWANSNTEEPFQSKQFTYYWGTPQ